ncbi:hypothetical protein [Amycolatopsis magusensis]|uniref:hypothetical protein n=1 Tax=Amycolatopsis magusensis TaxID=882444 RepID=UPI003C306747
MTSVDSSGSPRVFVSYAAEDYALALRISEVLAQSGIQVVKPALGTSGRQD